MLGALGAEPPAAVLGTTAIFAESLSVIGGGYIYFTEGDAGPFWGTVAGAAIGKISSLRFRMEFPGASQEYRTNRERVIDQAAGMAPNRGGC